MIVKFTINEKAAPANKLADAEIVFETGELAGLRLVGFALWKQRTTTRPGVTFPARQYSVNGERRTFALLRPSVDVDPGLAVAASHRLSEAIVEEWTRQGFGK